MKHDVEDYIVIGFGIFTLIMGVFALIALTFY